MTQTQTNDTDSLEELARRASQGEAQALAALVEAIQDDIYRLALRMLWHPQDAEDAAQEILIRIVTHVATFRGESSFRTWAFRVATNSLLNARRSRVEQQQLTFQSFGDDLRDGLADVPASAPYHADQALLEEEVKIGCTQAMLLCLEREDRVAYILGDVFELHSEQAGSVLDISAPAFRQRLARARARVRSFMSEHCGLVNTGAACSCARRVAPAIQRGRVDPAHLLFAGHAAAADMHLPVLEAVGEMERLHEIAAIHQLHPQYRLPQHVAAEIRRTLETAAPRLLAQEPRDR
jgi:RNA polymerase sigma factor (sigma-70 family)